MVIVLDSVDHEEAKVVVTTGIATSGTGTSTTEPSSSSSTTGSYFVSTTGSHSGTLDV
jgi:hypothetical protein